MSFFLYFMNVEYNPFANLSCVLCKLCQPQAGSRNLCTLIVQLFLIVFKLNTNTISINNEKDPFSAHHISTYVMVMVLLSERLGLNKAAYGIGNGASYLMNA